jgi:hypothetical protein
MCYTSEPKGPHGPRDNEGFFCGLDLIFSYHFTFVILCSEGGFA